MPSHGDGPIPARIMLVGEAWGAEEEREGRPFVGASGQELNRLLHEAGIMRSECYVTNLVNARPPQNDLGNWIAMAKNKVTSQHVQLKNQMVLPLVKEGYHQLMKEIALCNPNIIVPFGNWAMWALTGKYGIKKWRGSLLRMHGEHDPAGLNHVDNPKVIPTYHPAAILRQWDWRAAGLNDLRRVKKHMTSREYQFPEYKFQIRPSFSATTNQLNDLLLRLDAGELWLDLDLETQSGHIACCGISWSRTEAICIPFMTRSTREGYWSYEEECVVVRALYRVLTHKNARVRLQNGLYDAQYTYKSWHFIPRIGQDTMISQHAIFSDAPKALAYQASIYAEHYIFWKDEGKKLGTGGSEEEHWEYNLKDCVYTREVGEVEQQIVKTMGLEKVHAFQQAMVWPVLKAMNRGIRVVEENASQLAIEIQEQISIREKFMKDVLGFSINIDSPKQMKDLFYTVLNQPVIMTRATRKEPARPTCDDEALQKIGNREPILRALVNSIADRRTLDKFLGDFVLARRSSDGRMRSSFNIGGSESGKSAPKTYRLSSSKDAFGSGANLQTIPSEKSKSVGKWEQRQHFAMMGDPYQLPNLRSMYGPDKRYTFFDLDLDRADLQVVVWETNDSMLKTALRMGADIHLLNAYVIDGREPPPMEELIETHPKYLDYRRPMKYKREFAKVFCHATNYVGSAKTIAGHLGRTVSEVDRAQKIWFGAHPGIKKWHEDVLNQITKRRFVENRFGYRWYIFDRIDAILPEAVAWLPQSTVSVVINRIWMNLFQGVPEAQWDFNLDNMYKLMLQSPFGIEVLLQVHDSLAGQFPTHMAATCLPKLKELSRIIVPYDDPLIIPTGVGTSELNWGLC